jgi:hypothetical protein
MAGGFDLNTRRYVVPLAAQSRPTGGGTIRFDLPKTGLLARLKLLITGSVAGTLSSPNALGMSSVVTRARLTANNGNDVWNISGAGYHYLYRYMHNDYRDPFPASNARSAVTATTFDVSILMDIQMNARDPMGLIMLQNDQTLLTCSVEFLADASVATGATVTATVTPVMEFFSVPADVKDFPDLRVIHQVLEDQVVISGAGDAVYNLPRGNTYIGLYQGLGIGASPSDAFTRARLRLNQSNFVEDHSLIPQALNVDFSEKHLNVSRPLGGIFWDFMGSSGLGTFDKFRDVINSGQFTDLATVIAASGAGTLYNVRRQLVALQ